MKTSRKILTIAAIVLGVALLAGITIFAATSIGTQSDPLVTLSYLNDTAKKEFLASVDSRLDTDSASLKSELDEKAAKFEADINSKLGSGSSGGSGTDVFSVVTLSDGQTVACSVGAEIMLRIGSAEAYGSDSPALVDTTSASSVDAGTALAKNHMYMVTISGCGVRASAATTKILIRGDYTIS